MARSKNTEKTTLSVKDFGPIAEATVELRPLTVFVGASNTGKSYMAILLYALHRFFGPRHGMRFAPPALSRPSLRVAQDESREREHDKVVEWVRTLALPNRRDRFDVALPDAIAALVRPILEDVGNLAPFLETELRRCFGVANTQSMIRHGGGKSAQIALQRREFLSSPNGPRIGSGDSRAKKIMQILLADPSLGDEEVQAKLAEQYACEPTSPRVAMKHVRFWRRRLDERLKTGVSAETVLASASNPKAGLKLDERVVSYDFTIARPRSLLRASIPANVPLSIQDLGPRSLLWLSLRMATHLGELADMVLPNVAGPMYRPIHYLPADRAGVMHAHRVVVSSLIGRASRAGLGVEPPLPALSGVLADFLERLIELGDAEPRKGASAKLAKQLEEGILEGTVDVRSAVDYPSFHYQPANWKTELALMNTSSMVSELAPVVLYLRHIVGLRDVLIIEEPESHLHPAMQVAFTRFLATVVRQGIRVVVTTHSEWVLETLANLVRLSDVDKARRKEVSPEGLSLTPDEVGAWLFEKRKHPEGSVVKEIPLDVTAGTFPARFDEVSEALYNDWAGIANLVAERGA